MKTELSNDLSVLKQIWVFETKPLEEGGQQSATAFIFRNDDAGGSSKGNRLSHQMWFSASAKNSHLAHEVGDDPVEGGALEPEALLAGAEGAEVLRRLGHHVGTQLEQVILKYSF